MKLIRAVTGVVVSLPGAYTAFFILELLYTLAINFFIEGPVVVTFFWRYRVFLWQLMVISLLSAVGLILVAIVHVLLNRKLNDNAKGLWIVALLMGNVVTLPLYWYFMLWRQTPLPRADAAQQFVGQWQEATQRDCKPSA